MHGTGQYTISDLAELFSISKADGLPDVAAQQRLNNIRGVSFTISCPMLIAVSEAEEE